VAFWGGARSPAWIAAQYNAMSDAGGVIDGPEQLGMWVVQ
jgi:hypothetical protein